VPTNKEIVEEHIATSAAAEEEIECSDSTNK
jgi:hypothetical protein